MYRRLNDEKWLVVTFGSGKEWAKALKRIKKSVSKNTDKIKLVYVPHNEIKLKENKYYPEIQNFIINNSPGYGLWIWKPLVILDALASHPDANGVIYIDAGCELNLNKISIKRLVDYTRMTTLEQIVAFELQFLEYEYTANYVIKKILPNLSPSSKQVCATAFLVNNSKYTKKFLLDWYRLMTVNNFLYLKFEPQKESKNKNSKLIAHRNDQSIFSLLIRKNKIKPILDETFWGPTWKKGRNYPIWATRNRHNFSVMYLSTFQNLIRKLRNKIKNLDFNKLS
jgi:hypothetical protein